MVKQGKPPSIVAAAIPLFSDDALKRIAESFFIPAMRLAIYSGCAPSFSPDANRMRHRHDAIRVVVDQQSLN